MSDLHQCPACGFIGDLDAFDFAAADETGDEFSEPFDELICNCCNTAMTYEQLAEYDPQEELTRRSIVSDIATGQWVCVRRPEAAVQKALF